MSLFMLLTPHCAVAFGLDDLMNKVGEMLGSWTASINEAIMKFLNDTIVQPLANLILTNTLGLIKDSVAASDLICDFDHLLGNASGKLNLAALVTNVSDSAIKPVAATLLAMGMLLQLLKIAKKMDQGGGMMPSVREVVALFVWCAVMMYMVRNGVGLVKDLYTMVLEIIKSAGTSANSLGANTSADWWSRGDLITFPKDGNILESLMILVVCGIAWLIACLTVVISYAMMIGRAIEIYLTAMFAPIPFALMGFDETRSWGWGYLRQFLSLCLAGVVMVVVLYMFPYLVVSVVGDIGTGMSGFGTVFNMLAKVTACCIVVAMTLTKSSQIARSILGG
ncbi:type IV secretion system protein [Collinsella sp. AF38-3AC]|uniref:type IV secretion system protein n=1 Tax=Collinsella sp. AF38-3AC TaxID=2292015 RepID=UPI001313F65B|nr:type IV secretion system protein [Collinsella sp. AF38-3AC]